MNVRHAIAPVILALSCGLAASAQEPKAPPAPAGAAPAAPAAPPTPAAPPAATPVIDAKAKAVWDKAIAATRALKGIEMRSRMKLPDGPEVPAGAMPDGMLDEHRVVIDFALPAKNEELEVDSGLPGRVRIERLSAGAPSRVLVIDAKGALMLDPKAKTWFGGEEWPEIAGTMMIALPDWYMEHRVRGDGDAEARELLGGPQARAPEIDAMSVVGTETVDGVECDVIKVHRKMAPEDAGTAEGMLAGMTETYAFARTDGLPRRLVRAGDFGPDGADGEGMQAAMMAPAIVYTGVKPNPAIDANAFSKDVPEGFTKVDAPKDPFGMGGGVIEGDGPEMPQIPALKVKVGDAAPDFVLKDLDGKEVTLASLRGKVVLLDFWATWCGPCKQAMPSIQRIHEDYAGKDVVVLGVDVMEPGDGGKARDHMAAKKYTYRCLLQGDPLATAYGINAIPTLVVIGKDGKVAFTEIGMGGNGAEGLRKAIDRALAK